MSKRKMHPVHALEKTEDKGIVHFLGLETDKQLKTALKAQKNIVMNPKPIEYYLGMITETQQHGRI
jgi:hypothetical protein